MIPVNCDEIFSIRGVDRLASFRDNAARTLMHMKNFPLFIGVFIVLAMMALQAGQKTPGRFGNTGKSRAQLPSGSVCEPPPSTPPGGGQG
jgi:hypothetical protein